MSLHASSAADFLHPRTLPLPTLPHCALLLVEHFDMRIVVVDDDDDGLIYSGEGGYIHGCTEHMGTDRTTKYDPGAAHGFSRSVKFMKTDS